MGNPTSNNGYISRLNLDGENHEVIVPQGVTFTPKQLQVVPEHGKIYWCDREGMRVFRCNLDGSDVEVLVTTGETDQNRKDPRNWCVGIAVDPDRRRMYWTQKGPSKGNQGRLFTSSLEISPGETSGTRSDIKLLLYRLPEPIDLDLDFEENVLYLTDRADPPFGNSISRVELDPKKKLEKKILVRRLHEAIGLSLDLENRKMYFTDLLGALYKSDMDTSNEKVLFSDLGDLTGVTCLHG